MAASAAPTTTPPCHSERSVIFRIAKDYGVVEGPAAEIPSLRTERERLGPPWR